MSGLSHGLLRQTLQSLPNSQTHLLPTKAVFTSCPTVTGLYKRGPKLQSWPGKINGKTQLFGQHAQQQMENAVSQLTAPRALRDCDAVAGLHF